MLYSSFLTLPVQQKCGGPHTSCLVRGAPHGNFGSSPNSDRQRIAIAPPLKNDYFSSIPYNVIAFFRCCSDPGVWGEGGFRKRSSERPPLGSFLGRSLVALQPCIPGGSRQTAPRIGECREIDQGLDQSRLDRHSVHCMVKSGSCSSRSNPSCAENDSRTRNGDRNLAAGQGSACTSKVHGRTRIRI